MRPELRELIEDALARIGEIESFTNGLDEAAYRSDSKGKLAVERCFEILGEIFVRIKRTDPFILEQVSHAQKVISFRNILAHGYDQISDQIVWSVIQVDLPILKRELKAILEERGE